MNATIVQSALCKTRLFPRRPAPSVFFFPGLNTRPVFNPDALPFTNTLRDNTSQVLREYVALRSVVKSSSYDAKGEHKLHSGKWEWNSYIDKGKINADFAAHCPFTVSLLESLRQPSLMRDTPFSFCFFSTLKGGSNIAPHYGPSNIRIRCHLPLVVPEGDCGFRVGDEIVRWEVGKPLFFDDCFEHEAWNNTDSDRVVLLFDLWHPELHPNEVLAIQQMFGFAKDQGWISK